MAKFEIIEEDIKKIFTDVIANAELERYINIEILSDIKLKQVYKVVKANELTKHVSVNKSDVFIIVNDVIFDQLEEWQQLIIAEEAVTAIVFDPEKEKLSIKTGDVGITNSGAFSGILSKYGSDRYEVVQESIKTLYNVEQNEEVEI